MEKVTNPWLIMGINMTIVFGVLIALWIIMRIIYMVDPTRIKKEREKAAAAEAEKKAAAAPAPAPAPAAPVVAAKQNDEEIVAVIAAVVAMGYSSTQIASVRPIKSKKWAYEGRLAGRI